MSYTYALDTTGVNPTNLIRNESHVLADGPMRLFAPNFGSFFTESMKLIDLGNNNRELVKGVDYYPSDVAELPSGLYNKEICNIVVIKNPAVTKDVMLTYQVLGDFYEVPESQVVTQMQNIAAAGQHDWKWGPLLTPVKASQYPPTHYMARNDNRIGFEYQEHAIARIRQILINGFPEAQVDLYAYIDAMFSVLGAQQNGTESRLTNHIDNDQNPHSVTPDQLNVYTKTELNQFRDQLYNEFNNRALVIEANLAAHVARRDNPHGITAAMLQMWTKEQLDARLQQLVSQTPTGENGYWQLLVNSYTGGWSHYNDFNQAVFYSFTNSNGAGRVGNQMYVNGVLIADATNQHTNWIKSVQTYIMVPGRGTITIYTGTPSGGSGTIYGLRFVPTA
jgi:hypothetical protein